MRNSQYRTSIGGTNMSDKEEVDNVKEFMEVLMEVKIGLTELNGKVDNLTDMKGTLEDTTKTANQADHRSRENEKDIIEMKKTNQKLTIALLTVGGGFVLQLIYFLLTFGIN
mgnify:CR=1 FL=1